MALTNREMKKISKRISQKFPNCVFLDFIPWKDNKTLFVKIYNKDNGKFMQLVEKRQW